MKYCPVIKAECKGVDCVFCERVKLADEDGVSLYCRYNMRSMPVACEVKGEVTDEQ